MSSSLVRFERLGSNLLLGCRDARFQRSSFLFGCPRPGKQCAGLFGRKRASRQLPAPQIFLQLLWCWRLGRLGLAALAHDVIKPARLGDGIGPGAILVEESVRHTWRSSSDKTGQAASSSSVSVAGVSVTMTPAGSSPSATRSAVYHHGA